MARHNGEWTTDSAPRSGQDFPARRYPHQNTHTLPNVNVNETLNAKRHIDYRKSPVQPGLLARLQLLATQRRSSVSTIRVIRSRRLPPTIRSCWSRASSPRRHTIRVHRPRARTSRSWHTIASLRTRRRRPTIRSLRARRRAPRSTSIRIVRSAIRRVRSRTRRSRASTSVSASGILLLLMFRSYPSSRRQAFWDGSSVRVVVRIGRARWVSATCGIVIVLRTGITVLIRDVATL